MRIPASDSSPVAVRRAHVPVLLTALVVLTMGATRSWLDIVSSFDPPGLGDIDLEIGNLSLASFRALVPHVNDHENGTGPSAANAPFTIGPVAVSGVYNAPVTGEFSGSRRSFTDSGGGIGTWVQSATHPDLGTDPEFDNQDYIRLDFVAPPGFAINAIGFGVVGRANRSTDATITGTVEFGNGSTLSASITIDADASDAGGVAAAAAKDVFIGFQDPGGRGGIVRVLVIGEPVPDMGIRHFHGWDDVGVALVPLVTDSDYDGLDDVDELVLGTDPFDADSDDDGLLDGTEVDMAMGTGCPSPLVLDSDGDGLNDGAEVALGTSPCNPDSDGDAVGDAIDPLPTVPGVTVAFLELAARVLAVDLSAIPLGEFSGPNNNANMGRRAALANQLTATANAVAVGNRDSARGSLLALFDKIDGQPSPPDWMHEGADKTDLRDSIALLIALIEL